MLPYFNYGIILWHGSPNYAINRIFVAQKKSIRAICQLEFNGHTSNSFKELGILKIDDLYRVNLCADMFKLDKNPAYYTLFLNVSLEITILIITQLVLVLTILYQGIQKLVHKHALFIKGQ